MDYEEKVSGSRELISVYGKWPSFHDTEVTSFCLRSSKLESQAYIESEIELFEMTSEVDDSGYFKRQKEKLVKFRFESVSELVVQDFNHQNVLQGLEIAEIATDSAPRFRVEFVSIFGLSAMFACESISVVDITDR